MAHVLLVYAHPSPCSYTASIRDLVVAHVQATGADIQVLDLYANGFDPVLSARALEVYEDTAQNQNGLQDHCDAVAWCDTLIFVYPTWWYGMPAILKGWLDRVLVPGLAFALPQEQGKNIAPGLTHITRLGVYTTCGASWWLTRMVGAPGKRTLLRGVRLLCAKGCRTSFAAHYSMDSSTDASRAAHLQKLKSKLDAFLP